MAAKTTVAWAGALKGNFALWLVAGTRREVIDRLTGELKGLPAYGNLKPAGIWNLARKNGWRVVKVMITEVVDA
jgi:hypothetical protein